MSNWNGKIKCTYNNSDFTIDKIYEIKNGELIDDTKYSFGFFNNIDEINNDLDSQFEEVKEENLWNGKVKCIKTTSEFYTEGKIYNVIDGKLEYDFGIDTVNYKNINHINAQNWSKFEEVKENENLVTEKYCNSNVSKSDLPNKIPVLCGLLGVEVDERFKVNFKTDPEIYPEYYINKYGHLILGITEENSDEYVPSLINGEFVIIKLPQYQLTENEITTMSGLLLNDYYYIARDEDNNLNAFQEEPEECEGGEYLADKGNYCKLKDEFFPQVQLGNILDIKFELDKLN